MDEDDQNYPKGPNSHIDSVSSFRGLHLPNGYKSQYS
jgi:hypothetical protein